MIWHIIGDSFVEGVGATRDQGWAQQVAMALHPEPVTIDGVGGSTSHDVLVRLAKGLPSPFDALVIAVGINDSRYRISTSDDEVPPDIYRHNLERLIRVAQDGGGVNVFLIGLTHVDEARTMPFKADKAYRNDRIIAYDTVLREVAEAYASTTYVPVPPLNDMSGALADGLHPTDAGHQLLRDAIVQVLKSA